MSMEQQQSGHYTDPLTNARRRLEAAQGKLGTACREHEAAKAEFERLLAEADKPHQRA